MLICALGALVSFGLALALAGFQLVATFERTLRIFAGDRGSPIPGPDLAAVGLALLAAALLAGALALAVAGRRAALAIERASLIEIGA